MRHTFTFFLLLLISSLSLYSQDMGKVLNSLKRNTISELQPYFNEIQTHGYIDPQLAQYIENDLPRIINSIERVFPNAIYSFLGRDVDFMADIFESYFILKKKPYKVQRLGASSPSFNNASHKEIYQFVKTNGFDINHIKYKNPYLILDVISSLDGGRQPKMIFEAVLNEYLKKEKDISLFLNKFNIIGFNNLNENSSYDLKDAPQKISSQIKSYKKGLRGQQILQNNLLHFDLKDFRPSYDNEVWHGSFSEFYKEKERTYAQKGALSPKNTRLLILQKQKQIFNYIQENLNIIDDKITSFQEKNIISQTQDLNIELKSGRNISFSSEELGKLESFLKDKRRIPSPNEMEILIKTLPENIINKLVSLGKNHFNGAHNQAIQTLSQASGYNTVELQQVRQKFIFLYAKKIIKDLQENKNLHFRLFSRDMDDIYQGIKLFLSPYSSHLNLPPEAKSEILKRVKLVNINRYFAGNIHSLDELKTLLQLNSSHSNPKTKVHLLDIGYSGSIPQFLSPYIEKLNQEVQTKWFFIWKSDQAPSYISTYTNEPFHFFLKKRFPRLALSKQFSGDSSFRVGAVEHQARWSESINSYAPIKNSEDYQDLFEVTLSPIKERLLLLSENLLYYLDINHSKNFELQEDSLSSQEYFKLKILALLQEEKDFATQDEIKWLNFLVNNSSLLLSQPDRFFEKFPQVRGAPKLIALKLSGRKKYGTLIIEEIKTLLKKNILSHLESTIISHSLSQKEVIALGKPWEKFVSQYIEKGLDMDYLAKHVLSQKEVIALGKSWEKIVSQYIEKGVDMDYLAVNVLSQKEVIALGKPWEKFVSQYIEKGAYMDMDSLAKHVLSQKEVIALGKPWEKFVSQYIEKGVDMRPLSQHVLSQKEVIALGKPWEKFVSQYIEKGVDMRPLSQHVLSQKEVIALGKPWEKFVSQYIEKGGYMNMEYLSQYVLSQKEVITLGKPWEKFLSQYIEKEVNMNSLAVNVLSQKEVIALGEPWEKFVRQYLEKGVDMKSLSQYVLSQKEVIALGKPWEKFLSQYIEKGVDMHSLAKHVLSQKEVIALGKFWEKVVKQYLQKDTHERIKILLHYTGNSQVEIASILHCKPSFESLQQALKKLHTSSQKNNSPSSLKTITFQNVKYNILSELGKGKRAIVHLVEHPQTHKKYALKVAIDQSLETLNSFSKEIKKVHDLQNLGLHVAEIYAFEKDMILKKYIKGERADRWLERLEKENKLTSNKRLDRLKHLVEKISSQNQYVGDLNRKNLIWSDSLNDWVIVDSGSVREMKKEESLKRLISQISRRWSKSVSQSGKSVCNKLFLNHLSSTL